MKAELHTHNTVKLELILTDKEFSWMKKLLENPLYEDETPSEALMRRKWSEALNYAWQWFIPF